MPTETEMDALWNRYVGSSKLSPREELIVIRRLEGKMNERERYQLYLCSKIWRAIRWKVLKRDGMKCVKCGGTLELQVNHKKYSVFGNEKLEDLETLCRWCHADITRKFDIAAGKQSRNVDMNDGKLHLAMRRGGKP